MSHSNKRPRTTSSSLSRSHSPGPSEASTFNANDSQVSTSQNGTPSFVAAVRRERAKEKYVGKSPEDVLKLQKKTWRSSVYNHFNSPTIIEINGDIYYRFVCKRNPSIYVQRHCFEDSTGNLSKHVDKCEPDSENHATQQITSFAMGSTYSSHRFRYLLAMWCARRHRPFKIVADPELQELFKMLNARIQIPHPITVSRDVLEIFVLLKERVAALLKEYPGRIHIGVDGWTSPNVFSFLGVTVHRAVGSNIESFILDFIKLTSSHTGVYLAHQLHKVLVSYHIDTKLLGVVCDNATNNATMMEELGRLLKHTTFPGPSAWIRCFAHSLNLVVKAILSQFSRDRRVGTDRENNEDEEMFCDIDDADDASDVDEEERAKDAADMEMVAAIIDDDDDVDDLTLTREDVNLGRFSVCKITMLSKRVFHNPTIREELGMLCRDHTDDDDNPTPIPELVLLRPVPTRWNTMTEVLTRALTLQPVLTTLCERAQFNKRDGVRLRRFVLEDEEWELLQQLAPILELFLYVTKQVSKNSVPLIHHVIPFIDTLFDALEDQSSNIKNFPAIRMAAKRGRAILSKYYGHTDETAAYRIAMILNPACKLSYFRKRNWPEPWIKTAEELLREEWKQNYRSHEVEEIPAPTQHTSTNSLTQKYFGSHHVCSDPLDIYLADPPITSITNPLTYWHSIMSSQNVFAPLARMALDFLSMPAASTDVERAFSRGRPTVSRLRHSLSDETTRAATVLSSWSTISGLIPEDEIIENIRLKRFQWAKNDEDLQ